MVSHFAVSSNHLIKSSYCFLKTFDDELLFLLDAAACWKESKKTLMQWG